VAKKFYGIKLDAWKPGSIAELGCIAVVVGQ
jgi:hypothetical protein